MIDCIYYNYDMDIICNMNTISYDNEAQADEEEMKFWVERVGPSVKENIQKLLSAASAAGFDVPEKEPEPHEEESLKKDPFKYIPKNLKTTELCTEINFQ